MALKLSISILIWILATDLHASAEEQAALNDYISYFEQLTYDTDIIHNRHQRSRRSVGTPLRIDFHAHKRNFRLVLHRDETTFVSHPEEVLSDGRVVPLDTSHIYQGRLLDDPHSYVHGSVINGVFAGRIDTRTDTYYIDKSELYFEEPQQFHSVIYSSRDVDTTPRVKRSSDAHSNDCGMSKSDIREWMKSVQNSAVESSAPQRRRRGVESNSFFDEVVRRYTGSRAKRVSSSNSQSNRMCALLLQSDPMLWDYMTRPITSGGLGYLPTKAREEITALFAYHVDGIKKIYSSTVFQYQGLGPYGGFTFAVHRIQINTTDGCNTSTSDNPFCKQNIDVSNFLNLNSLTDHDLYCLAYVFTYRDFSQGTLGLAWVGSNLKASGGLCERWKEYNENNRRVYKSLNTGIVTLVNYGSRVPAKVSTLTFAHEIGHNFGSPHDSGTECVPLLSNPNDPNGNYIMYASATSGDRPNNYRFSNCSIGNMTQVLNAVLHEMNGKFNCFISSQEAFCGNRIVEAGEQCDCGFETDCHDDAHYDPCCYPQESEKRCQRVENFSCSPSEGPCCKVDGRTCKFRSDSDKFLCSSETECSNSSYCDAQCPVAKPFPNMTLCNSKTQVCINGDCTGSVCAKIGWDQCYLSAPVDDKNFNRGQLCYVSCLNPVTKQCVSSGSEDINKLENAALAKFLADEHIQNGIRLPAGAPCDNFNGYCDVFQKCRAVNEDGPLARLKNLLFNQQTLNTIKDWITEYWWAVLLMSLGLIVVMALFIKICAVHTPSSNPKLPPAQKLTLPRRHTHRSSQAQPPPYSHGPVPRPTVAGGPPHGKRRGNRAPAAAAAAAAPLASTSSASAPQSSRSSRQQSHELEIIKLDKHGHRGGRHATHQV